MLSVVLYMKYFYAFFNILNSFCFLIVLLNDFIAETVYHLFMTCFTIDKINPHTFEEFKGIRFYVSV